MNMFTTMKETKRETKDSHNEQSCNATALYERLSRDDVLSGESKECDIGRLPGTPDLVFQSLGEIIPYL